MKFTPLLAGIAAALLFSASQSANAGILTINSFGLRSSRNVSARY